MQVHPQKSREAHSQISPVVGTPAAASNPPHPDSLTSGCDLRGPYPVSGRSAGTGQPLVQWATPDSYLLPRVEPLRARILIIGILAALSWLLVLWLVGAL